MATKKFDIDHVVQAALALFWEKGYSATSMQHIVLVTGLKPGSIYHQFGSKEALFTLCLQHYADESIASASRIIDAGDTVLQGIRQVLIELVEASAQKNYCGCFLIKSQLELSSQNELVYAFCIASLQRIEANFAAYIARVYPADTATTYARQLMLVIFGIRVFGYQQPQKNTFENIYRPLLPWLFEKN